VLNACSTLHPVQVTINKWHNVLLSTSCAQFWGQTLLPSPSTNSGETCPPAVIYAYACLPTVPRRCFTVVAKLWSTAERWVVCYSFCDVGYYLSATKPTCTSVEDSKTVGSHVTIAYSDLPSFVTVYTFDWILACHACNRCITTRYCDRPAFSYSS